MDARTGRRRRRRWLIALAVVVVLVGLPLLLLDPIAAFVTRRVLGQVDDADSRFERVEVSLWKASYTLHGLEVRQVENGQARRQPFLVVDRIDASLDRTQLLSGHLAASVSLEKPVLSLAPTPEVRRRISEMIKEFFDRVPARIDRAQVRDGRLGVIDYEQATQPRVFLQNIEATLESAATRRRLAGSRPTVAVLTATVEESGKLSAFITADELAKPPAFAGQVQLDGLDLRTLSELVAARTDLKVERGRLDFYARFESRDGKVYGGLRPVLHDVSVSSAGEGFFDALRASVADVGIGLVSRDDEAGSEDGRGTVATLVPFRGELDSPDIQLWPAVLGVVRHAFIESLLQGFANLPPKADEDRGLIDQAVRALSPNSKNPIRAEPDGDEKKGKGE